MSRARPEPDPAEQFRRWLDTVDPDSPATRPYWTGNLAEDSGTYRTGPDDKPVRHAAARPEAAAVADLALAAEAAGRVALTQRRLGPGRWEYLATRLPPSKPERTRR